MSLVAGGASLAFGVAPVAQQPVGMRQVDRPLAGRFIVVLRDSDDPLAVGVATANLSGGRLRHVYDTAISGFAIDLPEAAASTLAGDPRVRYVERDGALTLAAAQGLSSWGLDRVNQRALPLDADYQFVRDGSGVNVHVVDTGIRVAHAEFGGRAFIAEDYVGDDGNGNDCHGHGTHVAGTIGGTTYGVAKNVTLWAHRVLDCEGTGSTSALIAAVDAITSDAMRRPAVANISVAAPASVALDEAIRRSISAGVTYVVAAGNGDVDSSGLSPARIAEAITVGATTALDRRASFSNFGAAVDLFAPGQDIVSAAIADDIAITTMSGTSTAAAHVAGVAALLLGDGPDASPDDVHSAVIAAATPGVLNAVGAGSPNRLLYSELSEEHAEVGAEATASAVTLSAAAVAGPYVTLITPNNGENWGIGSTQQIKWTHNLGAKTKMRIEVSRDGGATYSVLASAVTNKASTGVFNWTVTGPHTTSALIRVSWTGGQAIDVTDRPFTIAAPFVRVTAPNGGETWVTGSTATITWDDNLGPADKVEIQLSINGGGSYPTVLSRTSVDGSQGISVKSAWLTSSARVRVFWRSNSGVADASDNNFRIADSAAANQPPAVSLSAPANGATFTAPASITVSATASDTDGTIARVDFFQGATLIGSDTTSPYSIAWSSVPAGSYALTARAMDNAGATTTSTARTITVGTTSSSKSVVFTASPDHTTIVDSYSLEIFPSGADTSTATPIASQDLGKPPVVNGECTVDVTATIDALAPGTYQVTIAAIGDGGKSRSTPFSFTR